LVYPVDEVPLRLQLLAKEVERLREKLWDEVERARAARRAAQQLVLESEAERKRGMAGGG